MTTVLTNLLNKTMWTKLYSPLSTIPIHHHTQVQKLHPVEEDLMIFMKKHNLPIHLYKDLLALAERAAGSEYDFLSSPIYQTTLDCMKKKYFLEAGSPLSKALLQLMVPFLLCMHQKSTQFQVSPARHYIHLYSCIIFTIF